MGDDAIEAYLDELLAALRGTPRDIRRALAECEAHLREAAELAVASGRTPPQAAQEATAAFGGVGRIAAEFNRAHRPAAVRALLPGVAYQTCRLSAVGLIAIGVSGVIAWLWASIAGAGAVFADAPGTHYDAASCAHYLAVQPTARSCAAAALLEGRDDALVQRAAAGILGVLLLAASLWWQRRAGGSPDGSRIDLRAPAALVAATVFGAVGIGLTGYGIDRAVVNTGGGQWMSAGVVAIAVAAGYLAILWKRVNTLAFA
jgi:hypothetical protein